MRKMEDREALCNLIKRKRENNNKNNKTKRISIPLFKIKDKTLYADIVITVYSNTGSFGFGHGLKYAKMTVFPSKYQKLTCDNERGLEYLQQQRDKCIRYYDTNKERILDANKEKMRQKYIEDPELYNKRSKEYYQKNKKRINEKSREYYQKHREDIIQERKDYYRRNRERILEKAKLRHLEIKSRQEKKTEE